MKKRGIMAEETDIDTGMDGIDGVKRRKKDVNPASTGVF